MGAKKIFLCYRRGDSLGYVSRLENDLELAFSPDRVFRDVEDIKGGSKWKKVLENNLADAAAVLLVIGPRWGGGSGRHDETIDEPTTLRWNLSSPANEASR